MKKGLWALIIILSLGLVVYFVFLYIPKYNPNDFRLKCDELCSDNQVEEYCIGEKIVDLGGGHRDRGSCYYLSGKYPNSGETFNGINDCESINCVGYDQIVLQKMGDRNWNIAGTYELSMESQQGK